MPAFPVNEPVKCQRVKQVKVAPESVKQRAKKEPFAWNRSETRDLEIKT